MPLLLIPLVLLLGLAALVVLVPLGWVQRYRFGSARRRFRPAWQRVNAWLLGVSIPLLLGGAWISSHWFDHALVFTLAGFAIGAFLGLLGVFATRMETMDGRVHHTSNRWLVLALTLMVAGRVVLGLWQWWRPQDLAGQNPVMQLLADHASLVGFAGVLLGYAFVHACGLSWRARRMLG